MYKFTLNRQMATIVRKNLTPKQSRLLTKNIISTKRSIGKAKGRFQKVAKKKVISAFTEEELRRRQIISQKKIETAEEARKKRKEKLAIKRISKRLEEITKLKAKEEKREDIEKLQGLFKAREVKAQKYKRRVEISKERLRQLGIARAKRKLSKPPHKSSNVYRMGYDKASKILVVEFHPSKKGFVRPLYAYFNIIEPLYKLIWEGRASCRTEGENEYGSWYVDKHPTQGGAIWIYLRETGIEYIRLN